MKKLNIVVVIVSDTRTDDTDKSGKKLKPYVEDLIKEINKTK